jgi:hypothetical protein
MQNAHVIAGWFTVACAASCGADDPPATAPAALEDETAAGRKDPRDAGATQSPTTSPDDGFVRLHEAEDLDPRDDVVPSPSARSS